MPWVIRAFIGLAGAMLMMVAVELVQSALGQPRHIYLIGIIGCLSFLVAWLMTEV